MDGIRRGRLCRAPGLAERRLRELALADDALRRGLAGRSVRRVVVVPDRLVNVVTTGSPGVQ